MGQARRSRSPLTWLLLVSLGAGLAGCGGVRDGGPSRRVDLSRIPDAVPRVEPRSRHGNPASYVVLGKRYFTLDSSRGYSERGIASWYGSKFHGRSTSNGERYDMYAMTAAHKRLPLPTYARVTNLRNGRSVVVRINDRGPFHANRIIDLSYAAAAKLDIVRTGTGLVEVAAIDPARPRPVPPPLPSRPRPPAPVPLVAAAPPASVPPAAVNPPATAAPTIAIPRPAVATPPMAVVTPPAAPAPPETAVAAEPQLFLQVGAFGSHFNAERLRERVAARVDGPIRLQKLERGNRPIYRVQIGPLGSVERVDALSEQLQGLGLDGMHVVIE